MRDYIQALSLLVVVSCCGCIGRAFNEGYYGAKGATGRAEPLQSVYVDLAKYDAVAVQPFSDGMEGYGNKAFLYSVEEAVKYRIIAKTHLDSHGDKVLQVSGALIHYDTGTTADKIVSPMEQAICRVKLTDKSSGKVLGMADCISRAKSSFRKGPEELADGMGKAVAKWIIEHDTRGARPEEED